jgi:hypothetical protein
MGEDWRAMWQPLVEAVGIQAQDEIVEGPDPVELGSIRRYTEVLEFDCPLHYDAESARAHGYADVVAPSMSLLTHAIPPFWHPGGPPAFTSSDRNALPPALVGPPVTGLEPEYTGHFATDFDMEFLLPAVVGDRLTWMPRRLVSCVAKQTSVGRGVFTTWESELHNQRGEIVARMRFGAYQYNPLPAESGT